MMVILVAHGDCSFLDDDDDDHSLALFATTGSHSIITWLLGWYSCSPIPPHQKKDTINGRDDREARAKEEMTLRPSRQVVSC